MAIRPDGNTADLPALCLVAALCITLAWLIPNHYLPWSWFYNEATMALGLLLLVAAGWLRRLPGGLPAVAWALAGVALLPWLQWAFGLLAFSGDAWVASFYLLCLACAVATGFSWARTHARGFTALLASAALAAALVSSVIALIQCLQLGDGGIWMVEIGPGERATANLAQPNNLATLIGFGVLGLWLLREQARIGPAAAASLLGLLLIGAALTQSRAALLFGPVLWLIRGAAARHGVAWRTGSLAVAAAALAHLLLALLWPVLGDALLLERIDSLGERGVQSTRSQVWPILLDAVWQAPWAGYGWLQTGAAQLATATRHPPVGEMWLHGHNLFLDLLTWCGLPLGLALCALLAGWFTSRVRSVASVETALGIAVVAVFGVHAMLELPHHYLFFLVPVGLWIGVVEAGRSAPVHGSPRFAPLLACAGVALGVALVRDYPAVEADFRLMRFETSAIGGARATQPAPDAPFLSGLTASLRFARTPPRAGMSEAELASMAALVRRYPYSPSLYRYASALALNGRVDEARQVFDSIRHIHGLKRYQRLRHALHQQVGEGLTGLAPLDRALPP